MNKEYVVPIEAWVRVMANNSDEAFAIAVNEISSQLYALIGISKFGYVFNEPELAEDN